LLIDHQPYWREFSVHTLQNVGFQVQALATYNRASLQSCLKGEKLDLIVLGCTYLGDEEQHLIEQILDNKQHLLVLCTTFSLQVMRALFLKGVDDIEDKPYQPDHLVSIVDKVLASAVPHNGYQALEREATYVQ
jgi:DNA-binding NtrC family response regulator